MTASRLVARRIEKVWGQRHLPPAFGTVADDAAPVGEIHFEDPHGGRPELLVKYLFTAERLSIQVHPDDEAAHALGYPCGKDEAWLVLAAEPDAEIAIGLRHAVSKEELRAAATDGRIEELVNWRAAEAGDSYYSPAGTIHAVGPGLTLIEIQQNCDVTYRLFDYGRPRELHLDNAINVATPGPYEAPPPPYVLDGARQILADGRAFVLERWQRGGRGTLSADPAKPIWLMPLRGGGSIDGQPLEPGSAWLIEGDVEIMVADGADLLVSYLGAEVRSFDAIRFDPPQLIPLQRRRYRDAPLRKTA
jgi:mannose-6-phosphate isomerase